MTFLIDAGMVMYWGTARWTPFEIFEAYAAVSIFPKVKGQLILKCPFGVFKSTNFFPGFLP